MALRKNKRLRLTTNPQQDNGSIVHQTNNSVNGSDAQRSTNERDQRVQREQPSNERNRRDQTSTNGMQQRRQRDQISNHELREQREQRNQNPSNEMHQSSQRDQIFPNERSEHRQQGRQTNQQSSNLRHNNSSEESGGSSHRNDVYEYTIEDTNGNRRRGKTVLADVWNLPDGQRIVVEVNKENQPIGDEGGVLGYFCGTVARNGSLCSLTCTRWDLLKKGCNKNNQKLILQEVERRFLYPKALEKWILKSIGHKWRDYKCYLKGKGYDDDTHVNTLYDNCPDDDVDYDQWVSLVNFWRSEEGQKRSKRSKESHAKAKVKPIHTTGTKSHARVREEMKKNLNKSPSRTQVYLQCHQHESEADITNQIKKVATEQGDQDDLDDDPVSKVLGKDQYGRVRGLGLGVKPSDVGDSSYPRFCNGLKMSSDNEAAIIHYFRRLKDKVNRLRHRVRKQSYNMTKVKWTLEENNIMVTLVSETESETESKIDSLASESDEYSEAKMMMIRMLKLLPELTMTLIVEISYCVTKGMLWQLQNWNMKAILKHQYLVL